VKKTKNNPPFFDICQAFFEKTQKKFEKHFLKIFGEAKGCARGKCYKITENLEVNWRFWRLKKS
jgi:hypothetical protein